MCPRTVGAASGWGSTRRVSLASRLFAARFAFQQCGSAFSTNFLILTKFAPLVNLFHLRYAKLLSAGVQEDDSTRNTFTKIATAADGCGALSSKAGPLRRTDDGMSTDRSQTIREIIHCSGLGWIRLAPCALRRDRTLGLLLIVPFAPNAGSGLRHPSCFLSQGVAVSGHLQGVLANSLPVSAALLRLPEISSVQAIMQAPGVKNFRGGTGWLLRV